MKRCFTSLTTLLCSAAVLLCSLPMQALAAEFRMQTAYEDVLPDELTAQKEAPAAPAEPEAPEAEKQPEAPPEEPTVSVLSTDNRSGDFTYSVLSDNTAQITGYSGTAENLIVPDKLDGYTVTEIGKLCFSGNITLVSLKLPDTVTRIGTKAFAYCTNLASINYPLHLESAGGYYSGGYLFDGTRISSITVPEGGITLVRISGRLYADGCSAADNPYVNWKQRVQRLFTASRALYPYWRDPNWNECFHGLY